MHRIRTAPDLDCRTGYFIDILQMLAIYTLLLRSGTSRKTLELLSSQNATKTPTAYHPYIEQCRITEYPSLFVLLVHMYLLLLCLLDLPPHIYCCCAMALFLSRICRRRPSAAASVSTTLLTPVRQPSSSRPISGAAAAWAVLRACSTASISSLARARSASRSRRMASSWALETSQAFLP